MMKRVLFICTGNFYRSRFAEIWFNYLAGEKKLHWEAFSCGTEVYKYENNGSIAQEAINELAGIKAPRHYINRFPVQVDARALELADIIIALKKSEHKPSLERDFPHFEKKTIYWQVHDLDGATSDQAFAEIKALVGNLVDELSLFGDYSSTVDF